MSLIIRDQAPESVSMLIKSYSDYVPAAAFISDTYRWTGLCSPVFSSHGSTGSYKTPFSSHSRIWTVKTSNRSRLLLRSIHVWSWMLPWGANWRPLRILSAVFQTPRFISDKEPNVFLFPRRLNWVGKFLMEKVSWREFKCILSLHNFARSTAAVSTERHTYRNNWKGLYIQHAI